MEYKVIPFVASISNNKGKVSTKVSGQLENVIKKYADAGWRYVRLESVTTFVHPDNGCFGFGGRPGYTTAKQMIVFSKTKG